MADKEKLYNVLGIPRWGTPNPDGGVDFSSCHYNGTDYMAYTGHGDYEVLWDTATQGNPTMAEFEELEKRC